MRLKNPQATNLICRSYCSYYKPGQKEDMACQGFELLRSFIKEHPECVSHFPDVRTHPFKDTYHGLLHHSLCQRCDFLIDGCDFTNPEYSHEASPCGGYVATDLLLGQAFIAKDLLLKLLIPKDVYPALSPHCALKHLEEPSVYDIKNDELYEVDKQGFEFLKRCDGRKLLSDLTVDIDFLETCLREVLLVITNHADQRTFKLRQSPIPSLRYLELQLTSRCNLRCRHCYLGEPSKTDLHFPELLSVLDEFENMQGLRALFSGGEPLLYPELSRLNEVLPRYMFRKVLLTNGTLMTDANYSDWCNFDEMQFSLDGLWPGHEKMRGRGTFEKTMQGIETARARGMPVSIATMVHRYNLKEFEALARLVEDMEVAEWNIDVPCAGGRLSENRDFWVSPEEGAPFLNYATGGSYHGGDEPYACGYHLCTVTPEGYVAKCGFFKDEPLGHLNEGLEVSWKRARHIPLTELECAPCPHVLDCKGGCRFRAGSLYAKDPVMCALYGVGDNCATT